MRALGRLGVWFFVKRYGRSTRTFRWVDGRRIRWHPDSISAGNAWRCGLLEWEDMQFVRHVLQPGDVFIDVGANIGVYTLLATVPPNVDVLAFEPVRRTRQRLEEQLALNGVTDRVQVFDCVLSDADGEVRFTVDRDVTNQVVAGGDKVSDAVETLSARTLDGVVSRDVLECPVFLKVDTEGHDYSVLLGARELLEQARPPLIVEWNDMRIRGLLEPIGYRPFAYDPDRRMLVDKDWTNTTTSNLLLIVDRDAVDRRLRTK